MPLAKGRETQMHSLPHLNRERITNDLYLHDLSHASTPETMAGNHKRTVYLIYSPDRQK